MEKELKREKGNVKIPIIIVIIITLIVIGISLFSNGISSEKIYINLIESLADKMTMLVDKTLQDNIDINNNDVSISGNLQFDTSYDLNEFNILKNYKYGFQIDASVLKKIFKLNLSLKEKSSELLLAKVFFQNNKGYLDIPEILPYIMDLGEIKIEDLGFNIYDIIDNKKVKIENYKTLINELKEILIASLDKKKFTMNKNVKKTLNGKEETVTEYIYLLDKDNQERTTKEIITSILNNEECIRIIEEMVELEEDEIEDALNNLLENTSYENDIKLIVSTSNVLNEFVAFDIQQDDYNISYVNYNDKITLTSDDTALTFTIDDNNIIIEIDSEENKGTIKITETKENSKKINSLLDIDLRYEQEQFKLSIETNIDYDAKISKEKVNNAKSIEEYTEEEQAEIINNFMNKIRGTSLEQLFLTFMTPENNL